MKVSIHQPNYLPWLGLLSKIKSVDTFIIFNTAEFSRGEYFNRNRIRALNKEGYVWITIPIPKGRRKLPLCKIKTNDLGDWSASHIDYLEHFYNKSPFFDEFIEIYRDYYLHVHDYVTLDKVDWQSTSILLDVFEIDTEIIWSSELDDNKDLEKTDRLLNLLEQVDATEYLSGSGGLQYIEKNKFEGSGIDLKFQKFKNPVYNQLHEPFIPNLSAVDFLFNVGKNGKRLL